MIVVLGKGGHAHAVAALVGGCTMPYEKFKAIRRDYRWYLVGVGCSDLVQRVALFRRIGKRIASPHIRMSPGTVVFPHVTLGAGVIVGQNVVIYSGSIVEHGSTIGDHAWLSPGVILCGNVTIKPCAFLGAGAIVLPGVTIGEGAKIGAGAVVHFDIPAGVTIHGPRSAV